MLKKTMTYRDFDRRISNMQERNDKLVHFSFLMGCITGFIIGFILAPIIYSQLKVEAKTLVTPYVQEAPAPSPARFQPRAQTQQWVGKASYYSREGCLGCSKDFTMANGQKLDDSKLTVAFNKTKLNTKVLITNTKTGKTVTAKVTDRGGFERHGKIVDLSVATRDALG